MGIDLLWNLFLRNFRIGHFKLEKILKSGLPESLLSFPRPVPQREDH